VCEPFPTKRREGSTYSRDQIFLCVEVIYLLHIDIFSLDSLSYPTGHSVSKTNNLSSALEHVIMEIRD